MKELEYGNYYLKIGAVAGSETAYKIDLKNKALADKLLTSAILHSNGFYIKKQILKNGKTRIIAKPTNGLTEKYFAIKFDSEDDILDKQLIDNLITSLLKQRADIQKSVEQRLNNPQPKKRLVPKMIATNLGIEENENSLIATIEECLDNNEPVVRNGKNVTSVFPLKAEIAKDRLERTTELLS